MNSMRWVERTESSFRLRPAHYSSLSRSQKGKERCLWDDPMVQHSVMALMRDTGWLSECMILLTFVQPWKMRCGRVTVLHFVTTSLHISNPQAIPDPFPEGNATFPCQLSPHVLQLFIFKHMFRTSSGVAHPILITASNPRSLIPQCSCCVL